MKRKHRYMTAKKKPAACARWSAWVQTTNRTRPIGYMAWKTGKEGSLAVAGVTLLFPDGVIGYIPVYRTKTAARKAHGRKLTLIPLFEEAG